MGRSRYYSNSAASTSLVGDHASGVTELVVAATVGFPDRYPFTLTLSKNDPAIAEAVEVTGANGTTLTVTRGVDSTIARPHPGGALVSHDHTARDYVDAQNSAGHRRLFLFGG